MIDCPGLPKIEGAFQNEGFLVQKPGKSWANWDKLVTAAL